MTNFSASGGAWNSMTSEGPPPGSKRARLRGYLNEIKQTVQQQYAGAAWGQRGGGLDDFQDGIPRAYSDAAVVTGGEEQMILIPSYARQHTTKSKAFIATTQETSGQGRDYRDTTGAGEVEFMKQQWEEYEEDNAVVDVDVRGWVFSPQRGQMTRRQRVFVSLARQLAGLPAPSQSSPSNSVISSRDTSPHMAYRQRVEERKQKQDDDEAARQAEELVKRGESEAEKADRGEYSEAPNNKSRNGHARTEYPETPMSRKWSEKDGLRRLAANNSANVEDENFKITPLQKRATWNQPADMTPDQLAVANAHLMARLAPFMSNPLVDTPISAFFYNDENSRQRTIYTNAYGHFALRASLDFVPTHVRILASEKLSATEEVTLTPPKGISLISDIDDTVKHSAINSGAREIFRNAFIRDLADLKIEGVQEWYSRLEKMGVKFHYVSNSPWQLYPVLQKYFELTRLPAGSFHLKQYSGMLQGIFEPVAERKKSTLDRIASDFPERHFILVGDSGEADLEVYLDFVAENPGRVLAILIRDVTTPYSNGFFDSSMGALTGPRSSGITEGKHGKTSASTFHQNYEDDPELRAAIAASLKTLEEEEEKRNRPPLPPRRRTSPDAFEKEKSVVNSEDLIDLSNDLPTSYAEPPLDSPGMSGIKTPQIHYGASTENNYAKPPPPLIPRKPLTLQSKPADPARLEVTKIKKTPPPPPPTRRSNTASNISDPSKSSPSAPQGKKPSIIQQSTSAPSIVSSTSSYKEIAKSRLTKHPHNDPRTP
ncbi:hypothetical protein, variant [Verruconis gallopava]|uniref:Phosphatidate phosphatase APP1 catalytic domain-containing protein n=1 Tax=Verruconis gallopava TaxID=253628 RepID=A0A0D2B4L8_9PEZI|nr:hypothetical protein, variant [Verruconis gallopava]KIW06179.1 hypothetical protein, variant [Verruconis gallopava]